MARNGRRRKKKRKEEEDEEEEKKKEGREIENRVEEGKREIFFWVGPLIK